LDWVAVHESQSHQPARQEKLGWYMYQSWLGPIRRTLAEYAKVNQMNVSEWHRLNPLHVIEFRTLGDAHENYTQLKFDGGKLVVSSEKYGSFEGPQRFDASTLDAAADLWPDVKSAADGKSDPKNNLFFKFTIRKAFAEKEKFHQQFLERATKATGGAPWRIECDWVKTWEIFTKAAPNFTTGGLEFAYRHYYGLTEGLAWLCESAAKAADQVKHLNERVPTHVVEFRAKVHDPWLASNQCSWFALEGGKLVIEYHPRNLAVNTNGDYIYAVLARIPGF